MLDEQTVSAAIGFFTEIMYSVETEDDSTDAGSPLDGFVTIPGPWWDDDGDSTYPSPCEKTEEALWGSDFDSPRSAKPERRGLSAEAEYQIRCANTMSRVNISLEEVLTMLYRPETVKKTIDRSLLYKLFVYKYLSCRVQDLRAGEWISQERYRSGRDLRGSLRGWRCPAKTMRMLQARKDNHVDHMNVILARQLADLTVAGRDSKSLSPIIKEKITRDLGLMLGRGAGEMAEWIEREKKIVRERELL